MSDKKGCLSWVWRGMGLFIGFKLAGCLWPLIVLFSILLVGMCAS